MALTNEELQQILSGLSPEKQKALFEKLRQTYGDTPTPQPHPKPTSSTSNSSNDWWRFVPAPKAFDHIFTDQELYEEYNLTSEEINIIESVIKERK